MLDLALFGQVLVLFIVLGLFLASRQASIFHPLTVYLAFHAVVFVARPILVHFADFDSMWRYMGFEPRERDLVLALGVSSAALVLFTITCMTFGRAQAVYPTPNPEPFSVEQRRGLLATTLLLVPIIGYSIHSFMGGEMQGENIGGTFILTGASGYSLEAQYMAGPLICAWLALTRFKWTAQVPVLLYVAYRSYNGWNRWTIVLLFLGIALVYSWQKRLRWVPLWSAALLIPLFLLFHTLGQNRDYFKQRLAGEVVRHEDVFMSPRDKMKEKYDTQEFANFDYLCFIVATVPERTGMFTYGSQYLQLLTAPIPRKLWKEKPVGAPVGTFNLNAYGNFNGLTYSLPGDGWMSGGWIGLIITVGLAGTMLGLAHQWFWRHVGQNISTLFYLIGLAMLPQWFRDGNISIAKFLFWNLLPLFVWLGMTWLMGKRLVPAYSMVLPRSQILRMASTEGLIHRATRASEKESPSRD